MEKPVFTNTMSWVAFRDLNVGTGERKKFWEYTTKKGEKGWMSTIEIGNVTFVINVAKAIIDRFEKAKAEQEEMKVSDLEISSVRWPDKSEALVLHKVGANSVSI